MAIFLKNAVYVDWQSLEFKETSIIVKDGLSGGIQLANSINPNEDDTVLDCTGKIVTKSFGCGHHHVYSALARGMGAPKVIPNNFHEILKYVWWTLDKCLDLEMIEASALCTAMHCAKNGVTFAIDHHASPFAVKNSLSTIANAFDKVGVSHLLCYELSNRDGETSCNLGLEETESYLADGNQGLVGLHASFTVGNDLLQKAANLTQKYNSGIHVHVAEDEIDQEYCLRDHKKRVVHRYHEMGFLESGKTILTHCLHLDDSERKLIKGSKAYVAQNTESNLNNNVGFFNRKGLGDKIMLGTDGMHSDMLRSAKAAFLVGQTVDGVSPEDIYLRFRQVHHYLDENKFHGDGDNNLVILNYDSPTEVNRDNFCGHFVFGIDSNHVESVIANGRLIVRNKKILTVDEDAILANSRKLGKKLWKKMNESNT